MTVLNLTQRHATYARGDLTIIATWFEQEHNNWRPCLVIVRAGEEMAEDTIPCIIPLDGAWIWSEDHGNPRLWAQICYQFVQALRLSNPLQSMNRIGRMVHDVLGDLGTMPPYPGAEEVPVAELTITDRATGQTREVLL